MPENRGDGWWMYDVLAFSKRNRRRVIDVVDTFTSQDDARRAVKPGQVIHARWVAAGPLTQKPRTHHA